METPPTSSATPKEANVPDQIWNWHAQGTVVVQGDPAFAAKYSGPNSLNSKGEVQETISLDLFAGVRLWRGAEAHVDGLMWQGFGLSNTFGIEAFPNGDAYKAGTEIPDFMFARLFIRQTIGLGGEQEDVPDDQLTLAGKAGHFAADLHRGPVHPHGHFRQQHLRARPAHAVFELGDDGQPRVGLPADTVGYTTGICRGIESAEMGFALRIFPNAE